VKGDVAAAPWGRTGVHVDDLGPKIVEGRPRRWGRAGLAALAESIAATAATAATATVTSIVLVVAATIVTLSLTLAAIARGMR
jgi:hypothetical protein